MATHTLTLHGVDAAFLPMATESAALLSAIIAWSSGHLSTADSSYTVSMLEANSVALRELQKIVMSDSASLANFETNAAACLVLLTSDVCLGDPTTWLNHLKGAKHFITSAANRSSGSDQACSGLEVFKTSPEGCWILRTSSPLQA